MKKHRLTPMKFRPINPKIESNKKYTDNVDIAKYSTGQPINRYWTFDFIETISDYIDFDDVNVILDVGSRDGYQSVEFRTWFPKAKVVAFEANPGQLSLCNNVTNGHDIQVVGKAVGDFNGKTKFYTSNNNIGASSLLKINGHPRSAQWPQQEVEVDVIRLDNWCADNSITKVDLLWVDVQGAERMVFEGCGDMLKDVKCICTEVELAHMYEGSILKDELDKLLKEKGFIELQTFHMGRKEVNSLDEINLTIGECDVIYINEKIYKV
jgi:FkbM family methyltransferase